MSRAGDVQATRRQFLGWGAVAAGAGLGLAGCGSPVPVATVGPALGDTYTGPRVHLEYWNGFTGGDGPSMRKLVADFNASQDAINVRMNVVQWAQYYQRVVAAVHAGKGPDIGVMHVEQLATQASRQTISPIDEIVGELGADEAQYPKEVWQRGTFDGRRYGVPLDVHSLASYANTELVSGQDADPAPKTRSEFEDALKKLMDGGVQTPFWVPNRWPAHLIFLSLLWQFGGEPYSQDGTKATFDSDAGVQALEWLTGLISAGISPKNVAPDSQYTAFKGGKGAYTWDGIWQVNDLRDTAAKLQWSLAPLPAIGDTPAVWANSHQLVMFRNRRPDDNKLLAGKAFLRYLIKNSATWSGSGLVPAREDARATKEFKASPQAPIAAAIPHMRFLPAIPAVGEVQAQTLEIALSNAILGRQSPKDALRGAAAQASSLMQANKKTFER